MPQHITDRFLCGNLRWTSTGEVWASWRLEPLNRARTPNLARFVHAAHAALYRALPGREVLLQALLTWTDPLHVVDKMIEGVDLAACPDWAAECDALIDELAEIPFGQRRFILHVRLRPDLRQQAGRWARAAFNEVATAASLRPLPPPAADVARARDEAALLEAGLPAVFAPKPLTEAEMVWVRRHAQTRAEAHVDPFQAPDLAEELLEVTGRSALGEPLLDPSALTDLDPHAGLTRLQAPWRRRYLKVVTDTGEESYQAGLILSRVPPGMGWPDCELLGRIDDTAIPLDLAIRMTIRPRHGALRKNKRSLQQLNDQLDQVGDAAVQHAAQSLRLHNAAEVLAEYHADLQNDEREVEIESVIMASTAATSPDEVDSYARQFLKAPQNEAVTWARPIGAEEAIFWGMQPASHITPQLQDYRQVTHSTAFATAAPLTDHLVGADSGPLMGINLSSPLASPWHLDLFGDAMRDMSPTLAIVAEQGAGKSLAQKVICGTTVDRGGRMIATDNSLTREWFTFAESLKCPKALVDVADPRWSIDPLRMLPPAQAGPVVQSLLITLLNVAATDVEGRLIAKVVKPAYLVEHRITSMGQLHRHLARDCPSEIATMVGERLDVFSDIDSAGSLAAAIFDPDLPAADLNARAIVIGTSNVSLPTREELASEHRFRNLGVDKIFGRALYALIARLAKQVCFSDPGDPAVYDVDEAHHQTSSEEAIQVIIEFIRYGRKQKAALVTGSHDPEADYPSDTLRGLIKNRLVMRQTDLTLARNSARFLGFDADDDPELFEQTVADIRGLPAAKGVGVLRDSRGRLGTVQVMLPARPERRQAVLSTPPEKARR